MADTVSRPGMRAIGSGEPASCDTHTDCTAPRKPTCALREACSNALVAWPAQTARPIALEALIALGFRSLPFHDPFHGPGQASDPYYEL